MTESTKFVEAPPGKTVLGQGPENAALVVIGDAPGRIELEQSKTLSGPSGKLTRKVIADLGYDPEQVRWENVFRTAIPNLDDEAIEDQRPSFEARMRKLRPKAYVALGITAARSLVPSIPDGTTVSQVQGKRLTAFDGKPVFVTFHPAYILRRGQLERAPGKRFQRDLARAVVAVRGPAEATRKQERRTPSTPEEKACVSEHIKDKLAEGWPKDRAVAAAYSICQREFETKKGGPGSGNFGHAGRPGARGGSAPKGEGGSSESSKPTNLKTVARKNGRPITPLHERFKPGTKIFGTKTREERATVASFDRGSIKLADVPETYRDQSWGLDQFYTESEAKDAEEVERALHDGISSTGITTEEVVKTAKADVTSLLASKTGLRDEEASKVVSAWAHTSNDSGYMSLKLQEASQEVLGTKLSDFQEARLEGVATRRKEGELALGSPFKAPWEDGDGEPIESFKDRFRTTEKALQASVKAQYEETQDFLKKAGIAEVTLYRGVVLDRTTDLNTGDQIDDLKMNALESWSSDKSVAAAFGTQASIGPDSVGVLLQIQVPRERIFSTPRSGVGCFAEREFVVHNNGKTPAIVVRRAIS